MDYMGINSNTINTYDNLHVLTKTAIEDFDSEDRLTTVTSYNASGNISFKYVYNYDDVNHSITKNKVEGSIVTPVFLFKLNATGLIYYQEDIINSNTPTELVFDGNLPTSMFIFGNSANLMNFNYYPNG